MKRYELNLTNIEKDTRIEFFIGSGPGGQNRNKRETGVRLKHLPTGIVIEAEETRSQLINRDIAFKRLQNRLVELAKPKKERIPTKPSKSVKNKQIMVRKIRSAQKAERRKPWANANDSSLLQQEF